MSARTIKDGYSESSWRNLDRFTKPNGKIETVKNNQLVFIPRDLPPNITYDQEAIMLIAKAERKVDAFNKFLNDTYTDYEYLGQRLCPDDTVRFRDEDSKKDSGLWGADLVAGSFRHLHVYNDPTYTDLLQPKFLETGSRIFFGR